MDIAVWLRGIGLEEYPPAFRDHLIDLRVSPKLTTDDLEDLGVTAIGDRRILLEAIAAPREPKSPTESAGKPAPAASTPERQEAAAAAAAPDRTLGRRIYAPGALSRVWAGAGLVVIDERSLTNRVDFADFADYWRPCVSSEDMLGAYVACLGDARRGRLIRHLRRAYPLRST